MPASLLPSFLLFAFVGAISPGPANLCSLSAALNYGARPALRQWRGLVGGYVVVACCSVAVSLFLGQVAQQYAGHLSWVGAAYILWLAWHILRDRGEEGERGRAVPSFRTGFLLQCANVKVMLLCLTAMASFVLPYSRSPLALFSVAAGLLTIGPCCNLAWLFAGAWLQRLLARYRRQVNAVMALSLALCAVSLVWPH